MLFSLLCFQPDRCISMAVWPGEESKVILVSLVRSNSEGSAGFLSESNRINVLLSRYAKPCRTSTDSLNM